MAPTCRLPTLLFKPPLLLQNVHYNLDDVKPVQLLPLKFEAEVLVNENQWALHNYSCTVFLFNRFSSSFLCGGTRILKQKQPASSTLTVQT